MAARRSSQEEWQEAGGHRRRRRRRRDSSQSSKAYREIQITKFYVSNLPENCSRQEVARCFGDYGKISNVFIAKKRDAAGNIFGFLSFVNVYDGLELQRRLRKVVIGKNKLKVNIAKFAVENFDTSFVRRKPAPVEQEATRGYEGTVPSWTSGISGRSFRDMLTEGGDGIGTKKMGREIKVKEGIAAFEESYGRAVVGKVVDFELLRKIKEVLKDSGWDGFEVIYLGGMYIMVKFDEED